MYHLEIKEFFFMKNLIVHKARLVSLLFRSSSMTFDLNSFKGIGF